MNTHQDLAGAASKEKTGALRHQKAWEKYLVAIGCVLISVIVRQLFAQLTGILPLYVTFYPAIFLIALYGDFLAALLATFLSVFIVDYFWIYPFGSLRIGDSSDLLAMAVFLMANVMISWLADKLQRANAKIMAMQAAKGEDLERQVVTRTAELHASERIWKAIGDSINYGVWVSDPEGRNTYHSPLFLKLLGRTQEQCLGFGWVDALHPDDKERVLDGWKESIKFEGIRDAKLRFRGADGKWHTVLGRGTPVRDEEGKIICWVGINLDIGSIEEAERNLRDSNAKLFAAIESMSDAVFISDTKGNFIEFNEAFAKYLKFSSKAEAAKTLSEYQTILAAYLPDGTLAPLDMWAVPRALRGETAMNVEYTMLRKDTGRTWIGTYSFAPIRDAEGEITGSVVVARDVTERKKAELDLMRANALLRGIGDCSPDPIFAKDSAGRFLYANPATLAVIGKPAEEVIGHTDVEWHDNPEQAAAVMANDRRVIENGCFEVFEETYDAVGLGKRIFRSAKAPLKTDDGSVLGVVVVSSDITPRKQMEQELRRTSDFLRVIMKHSPDIIFAKDCQGRLIHASQSVFDFFGMGRDEILGHRPKEYFGDPQLAETVEENDRYVLESGQTLKIEEQSVDTIGKLKTFLMTKTPWITENGTLLGLFGIGIDITELKAKEQELLKARDLAERSNLSKSKFLALASHDLRQPVQSLAFLLSAIEGQVADQPHTAKTVGMMKKAVESVSGLLKSILDISRLDANVVVPKMEGVDLSELVDRLNSEYSLVAANKRLKLRSRPKDLWAWTDRELLERVLRNLIENAIRYTAKGGVIVSIRQRDERVKIDVADTGIGIPTDKRTEIFEEFFQVNNPGRDGAQGMGLGLAIVARIVRLLGGEILVSSRVGRGSRFSVLLPLHSLEEPNLKKKPATLQDCGGRLLVIEDNEGLRESFMIILKAWGYDVLGAASGEEALDLAVREGWRFDAIVADHRLGPGLTGTATAQEIARRAGKSYPTLVLTGDTAVDRITEISASGFTMLHKPVLAEVLHQSVAQLLAGRQN